MGVELKDYIKVYDDAVKGDFCDVTIETFETKGRPQYLDRQQRPTFHDLNIKIQLKIFWQIHGRKHPHDP